MRVVILAGGLGTRSSEETEDKPKPMVSIAGMPILWHLMNIFSRQNLNSFVLALGYKQDFARHWVTTFDNKENWIIDPLDTGLESQTGGRIKKCMTKYPGERLLVTYGDGLSNVSIDKLISFHHSHEKLATVTAVRPPARFGYMHIESGVVKNFGEKNQADEGWINGGFFILEPEVNDFITDDFDLFETGALPKLANSNQLMAYQHTGFWQPMDTLREKNELEKLAQLDNPPWLKRD
jgi:glucose-1-phosphate cytidylyltransferase